MLLMILSIIINAWNKLFTRKVKSVGPWPQNKQVRILVILLRPLFV